MPYTSKCCCSCPSKEETGLPDALVALFNKLTSSGDGIPSDVSGGNCPDSGSDWYYKFRESSALIDLLTSLTFDYIGSGPNCGPCCYNYVGRGSYTPECPESEDPVILFGPSPFRPKATGDFVTTSDTAGPSLFPVDTGEGCCPAPSTMDCTYCRNTVEWSNGEMQSPQPIHGTASLGICVSGTVVTVCISLAMVIPCKSVATTGIGSCAYTPAGEIDSSTFPDCTEHPEETDCDDGTEGCDTQSVEISLSATFDVAAVSGDTIWEKIKNAASESFVSDFEYAACSCAGGGCSGGGYIFHCGCNIESNCQCSIYAIGAVGFEPCESENDGGPYPVDVDCIFATGTIDIAFEDV